MKVFISWSGKRSKETAEVLSSWIRQVIQAAETWISLDINKGARWNEQINKELEETKVGIICLNKENLTSDWILFEAGALSKTSDAHVCTFLLDVSPADIKPPLGQFQHTHFSKEDIKKLVNTINKKIVAENEKTIPEKVLDEVFEIFWPKLEEKLNGIKNSGPDVVKQTRTDREILEEILQTVRGDYKQPYSASDPQRFMDYLSSNLYYEDFYSPKSKYILKSKNLKEKEDNYKILFNYFKSWLEEKKEKDYEDGGDEEKEN